MSVITEKSSATLHTMVEETHQCQQQLVHPQHQSPSKGKKLYNWVKNQSAQIHQRKRAHSAHYARSNTTLNAHYVQNARLSTRKVVHFYERRIYGSCWPLNHF
jgi:hypothetical protein